MFNCLAVLLACSYLVPLTPSMPATFLQQCDAALGKATWDGSLGEPIVEHVR